MNPENNLQSQNNSVDQSHTNIQPPSIESRGEKVILPLSRVLTANSAASQEAERPSGIASSSSVNDTAPITQLLNTDPPTNIPQSLSHKLNKLKLVIPIVVLLLVIIGGFSIDKNAILGNLNIQHKVSLLSTTDWKTYSDSNNSVEFKYPDTSSSDHLDGSAAKPSSTGQSTVSDSPSTLVSESGDPLNINFPNTDNNALGDDARAGGEGGGVTSDLQLSISLTSKRPTAEKASQNGGINNKSLETLQSSGGYTYKIDSSGNYYQCSSNATCTNVIQRNNSAYPYAVVSVSVIQGGYSYKSIDTNSHNFKVMETVLSNLNLNLKQTNSSTYSVANNQDPCYSFNQKTTEQNQLNNDLGSEDLVTAVDPIKRTITMTQGISNYGVGPQATATYNIPLKAEIVESDKCNKINFDSIRVNDNVGIYAINNNSKIVGYVEVTFNH